MNRESAPASSGRRRGPCPAEDLVDRLAGAAVGVGPRVAVGVQRLRLAGVPEPGLDGRDRLAVAGEERGIVVPQAVERPAGDAGLLPRPSPQPAECGPAHELTVGTGEGDPVRGRVGSAGRARRAPGVPRRVGGPSGCCWQSSAVRRDGVCPRKAQLRSEDDEPDSQTSRRSVPIGRAQGSGDHLGSTAVARR